MEKNKFRQENWKTLLAMDIAVICIILMNLGALLLTNALVVKSEPASVFYEINPAASDAYDFEQHPDVDGDVFMKQFAFFSLFWATMTLIYIINRRIVKTNRHLYILMFFVLYYGVAMSTDFINNLGYWIGTLIWGA